MAGGVASRLPRTFIESSPATLRRRPKYRRHPRDEEGSTAIRIAIVGPAHPYKGGGAQHTTELAHRLAAAGHDVTIESWSAQYPALLYPGRQTVDAPETPPFPDTRRELSWRRPDGWLRLGRRLRREADAVVVSLLTPVQVPAYLTILRGCRGRGTRTLALCHNVLPHERRAVDVTLVRALLRRVDAVLTHSPEQARLARSLTSAPTATAALPPHLPTSDAIPGSAVMSGQDAALPPYRRLLFFGIVRPYKGLDVLLRALARGPADVSLLVAGEFWGGVEETRRLVGELALSDRVTLRPGYVPAEEVPSLFTGVDALVLPYRAATASQNAWLAHEHGVPVVATRTGALADHVRDGVDGVLCEPDDVDDLARALERFYAPGEPERLRAAVRPVEADSYWAEYVDALICALKTPRS